MLCVSVQLNYHEDFDPNSDSPVEILHVVLLGVVKYFWRDACARQNHEGKRILKTRLSSLDVDGLGISPLRGHTLVYYAGSLVGRDFRAIVQVAPAVLHGLIPDAAYEAWLALSRLAPLVFQPEIDDLPRYKVRSLSSSGLKMFGSPFQSHADLDTLDGCYHRLPGCDSIVDNTMVQQTKISPIRSPSRAYPALRACMPVCHGDVRVLQLRHPPAKHQF